MNNILKFCRLIVKKKENGCSYIRPYIRFTDEPISLFSPEVIALHAKKYMNIYDFAPTKIVAVNSYINGSISIIFEEL